MKLLFLSILIIPLVLQAQVSANFDSKNFGDCEVRDAAIGPQSISVRLFEKDMEKPGSVGAEGINKQTLGIIISAKSPNGFKFPISPRDSVIFNLTDLQQNLDRNSNIESQLQEMEMAKLASEKESLNSQKLSVEEESKIISEKLMAGEISAEEAMTQMEEISQRVMEDVEGAYSTNVELREPEEMASFSVTFYDTYTMEEANIYSGRLYIKKFNEKEFRAEIQGEFYTVCLENRLASSAEAAAECRGVISQYLPQTKVLREGPINGSISFDIDRFEDNR